MKSLRVFLVLFLVSLFPFAAHAQEGDCDLSENPRCGFEFEEDGTVKTESGKPERTFSLPPFKGGFVFDFYNRDITPSVLVQMFDFEVVDEDFGVEVGVATSRLFVSLSWEIVPIVKIGPSVWAGYHISENDPAFGLGVSILDF